MMRKVTSILGTAFVALGFSAGLASANGLTLNITDTGYDPIPAGGTIQYAVRIQNGGNVREAADTITFAIPTGGVYVGVSGGLQNCTPAPELTGPAAVTCDVPSLAPREQLTGHVLVRTTGSGTLSFTGTIVNAAVNVDQGTTVVRGADLSLELDAPAQVQAGDNVTLTATITNEGPDTSDGATFSLTLPSGLSSNVSLPAGCSIVAGMINCTVPGPIAAGDAITLDFTTQVTTDNASNIAMAGSVTGTSPLDPNLSNDADSVSIAVQPGTDVSLSKSRSPSGLIFTGSPVTFTLTPGFAGGAPLEAQISDIVPSNYIITGVNAAGAGWTCPSPVGNAVSCSYSAASPSGADYSAPITITAIAATDTAASGPVVNTAEITSPTDVLTTNNSASDGGADIAVPMFDLVAHKGSPPHALVTVGNQYDWPIWTQNTGNVPFKGRLIFTDHLPAGLRLDDVVVPAGSNWTCNVTPPVAGPADITCYTDDYATTGLPVGGQTPQLNIRTTVLEEGNLTNGLTVGYSGQEFDDRDLSNNTTSTGVGSGEGPQISDLRIEKTVTSTGPYVSGDPVSFRIEIINPGNSAAESVVVTDRLADLYFADASTTATVIDNATGGAVCSVTRGAAFYSDLRCEIATLPICSPGVDCPFIELTVLAGGTGNKSNTAETYSTVTPDPDYTNNSATAPYAVTPRTDVVVEKSASHDEGASLPAGQQLIYTIAAIVPANGLSDAENVTVTDSLPAGLRIVSVVPSQGSCGAVSGLSGGLTTAGSSVVCNLGTIQNGSQHSVTVVTVPSTALTGSAITNSVSVSTTTPEIDSTNNSDAISHQILAPALDLIINKIDSTDPLELGGNTVYTVTAINAGPSEAFSVVMTDTLPTAGMQLVAVRPMTSGMACNLTSGAALNAIGGSIVCSAEHLAVNQSLILEVEMTGVTRGRWTNSARVTSAEAAYDPQANNVVNETTSVYERADLRVSKTASAPEADLLEGFDWDIVVSNVAGAGIGLAEDVELVDQLPAHMELTGAPVPSLGNCDGQVGGRDVICILPDMPAGSSISIRVPVRVTAVTSSPQIFSNSATVSTLSFDDESNNTATGTIDIVTTQVSGTVWRDFDFNQIRDLPQDSGVSGVSVLLTGTDLLGDSVTRTTTTDAAGNYVFALLPPGVAYQVSYTIPTGGTFTAGSAYPAGVGGGTASGTQSILGITATTAAPAVTKDFSLIPVPGLALSKSATAPVLRVDGTYSIEYTFRLQNNSQEPITNVRLRDTLDPLFGTFSGALPAPGSFAVSSLSTASDLTLNSAFNGSGNDVISGGTIAPQSTALVKVTVLVNPPVPRPGSSMTLPNTAALQADGQFSGLQGATDPRLSDASNDGTTPTWGLDTPTEVVLNFAPEIELTKTANISQLSDPPVPGDVITYTFSVANTGNTPLLNVTVADPMVDLVWTSYTPVAQLAAGTTSPVGAFIATYTLKQSDIDSGLIENTATATGKWGEDGSGDLTVTDDDTETVTALAEPGLTVVKALVTSGVQDPTVIGDTIRYSFTVTNTGNTQLNNLVLTDALPGIEESPAGAFTIGSLAPFGQSGNQAVVYAEYAVTQVDIDAGSVTNRATVDGDYLPSRQPISANSNDIVEPLFQNALMRVTKVATTVPAEPFERDTVTWTITIENIGNTSLVIDSISEPLANTTVSPPAKSRLAPGESTTATATHTLSQVEIDAGEVENQVEVAGTVPDSGNPFPDTPSGNDPSDPNEDPTVTPLNPAPAIALKKELITDVTGVLMPGDEIEFLFTIQNTGNVTLNQLTLTDDLPDVVIDTGILGFLSIPPGASLSFPGTYVLKVSDLENGGLENTAVATGTDPNGTVVTDDSGTELTNDDPTVVSLVRSPSIRLTKAITTAPTDPVMAGDIVTYSFTITNTGNVELRDILLTELDDVSITGSRTTPLAAGGADSTTFTASYTLTQADVDAGIFTNDAEVTAVGTGPAGTDLDVDDQASVDLTYDPAPGLTLVKSADDTGVQNPSELGDQIVYSFTLTNTGNVTLTDVTVTDPLPGLVWTAGNVVASLEPGAANAVILTATYDVTQADIDFGRVDNQASAEGDYFDRATGGDLTIPEVDSDPVTVPLTQGAAIDLVKTITSTLSSPAQEGEVVTYGFTVTNTGNVTLTNVSVDELLIGAVVSGGPIDLDPGEADSATFTATYTLTQADIERGNLDNRAEASGDWGTDPAGGGTVTDESGNTTGTDEDTTLVIPQVPGIELVKTGSISGFADVNAPVPGDEIRYSFTVTNTGNVILSHITLTDLGVTFDAAIAPFTLNPGDSRVLTDVGGYDLTQADINRGLYENTAEAEGEWGSTPTTISDDDTVITPLTPAPSIDLVKVIDTANSLLSTPPMAGDVVHYDFAVTNTGNVTLTDVTIDDPLTGILLAGSLPVLEPGATDGTSLSATYVLTQADVNLGSLTNQATATGTWSVDGSGVPQTVSDDSGTSLGTDDPTVLPLTQQTGISVVKSAVPALSVPPQPGDLITYSFLVTNTGNVTLTAVELTDPLPGLDFTPGGRLIAVLEPGAINAVTLTATYPLRQHEIEAGEVVNTATVDAIFTDPGTNAVTNVPGTSNTVVVPIDQLPELSFVKTASSAISTPAVVGETITYTFTVKNTGNVLIEGVSIADPLPGMTPAAFTLGDMAPGAIETRTATYQITQDDIDAGQVENQALASGTFGPDPVDEPSGPSEGTPGKTIVPVPQDPQIELVKRADATALSDPAVVGQQILYSFTVTNTGNVTLRDVEVADPLTGLTPGSFTIGIMAPGDIVTVGPAGYAITAEDITAGNVTNRALASGDYGPPGSPGTVTSSSMTDKGLDEPTVTPVSGVPAIALVKALDPSVDPAGLKLGDPVRWVFTVTNTGNVPLTGITLTETLAGATVSGGPISLLPGQSDSTSFSAVYTVKQSDLDVGSIENQAIASGTFDNGTGTPVVVTDKSGTTVTDDDPTVTPLTRTPLIDLVKTVDASALGTPPRPGDLLHYRFAITNIGDVTLTGIVLNDPMPGLQISGGPIASLAPGQTDATSFTAVYALTQADIDSGEAITNQAEAVGNYVDGSGIPVLVKDISGTTAGANDPTRISPVRSSGLKLEKTADASGISASAQVGEEIIYTFTLTNTGNVTLTNVTVSDPLPGLVLTGNPVASIAPGDSVAITGTYAITLDDIRAAKRENTATASGTWQPAGGPAVTVPSDPASALVELGYPELELNITVGELRDVNGDGMMGQGDQVIYRFEVINTGTVALNGVTMDPASLSLNLPGLVCVPITLQPGERAFLECSNAAYTLTAADVDRGQVVLSGDATGSSDAGVHVSANSSTPAVPDLGRGGFGLEKLAGVDTAMVGDVVPYTIRITSAAENVPLTARIIDQLPAGFLYREGSARLDGVAVTPSVSGRNVTLDGVRLDPGQTRQLTLNVLIGSSVKPGAHTNRARLVNSTTGGEIAKEATATIRVLADAVMQCATVLGRVFDDTDQNGHMSKSAEERGLPNIRLIAPNGVAIVTDEHGRFNVPCAALPQTFGSNYMLKLDERTLPAGYRLTTENPRVVRLTQGMITRLDFGATLARLVRVDLSANAFEANGDLKPALHAGLQKMVGEIRETVTMLRISYVLAGSESDADAKQRLRRVERAIHALWRDSGKYKLNIETVVERAGVAQ